MKNRENDKTISIVSGIITVAITVILLTAIAVGAVTSPVINILIVAIAVIQVALVATFVFEIGKPNKKSTKPLFATGYGDNGKRQLTTSQFQTRHINTSAVNERGWASLNCMDILQLLLQKINLDRNIKSIY